jgi:cyclic pyranopterin phosphate synthase
MSFNLSHIDADGTARMVDIGPKSTTRRRAVAEGFVRCSPALTQAIRDNAIAKGDLLGCARIAGIMSAKRVDELIPLCHTLALEQIVLDAHITEGGVRLVATATTSAKTGVEMEALTAVAVASLTVIDMGKSIDKGMVIERIRLLEKTGGSGGDYRAPSNLDTAP